MLNSNIIYVKTQKTQHLRNGTSNQNFKIPKTHFNAKYPPKPRKNHLRIYSVQQINIKVLDKSGFGFCGMDSIHNP